MDFCMEDGRAYLFLNLFQNVASAWQCAGGPAKGAGEAARGNGMTSGGKASVQVYHACTMEWTIAESEFND